MSRISSLKKALNKIYFGDNIVSISELRYLPRWIILFIDIVIILISIFISYEIVLGLGVSPLNTISFAQKYLLILCVNVLFMYIFKTFSGIIRHSTFFDLFKLLLASFFTVVSLELLNLLNAAVFSFKLIRTPVLLVYFSVSFTFLFMFRLLVKEFFNIVKEFRRSSLKKRILILGIDEQAVAIGSVILDNSHLPYQVVGFITERQDSKKVRLLGKPIYSKQKVENNTKEDLGYEGVLIIKEMMSRQEMNDWVSLFLSKDIKIFKAPTVQKLRESDLSSSIKNLQIEDLLNRRPIVIENNKIKTHHQGKTVLITGGAGSIGSEIVRQVAQFNPKLIVVLDQAETPLYEIELEVRKNFPYIEFKFVLLDVRNLLRLECLFKEYKFSVVYHAAAYKHVPLVEDNPQEAVMTNISGSKNLACLSSKYSVERFVMVSTDKAVNPTNVMGATKRAAELFVQSMQNVEGNVTKFITTRFGNVLGSNGSVIPLFRKQIEGGGPVTITHPEIVRYFMTIPEACELVLEAGAMGKGGEVFVFDMGEPVKILDLAKRMIKLSGFEPNVDIKIIFTGLRSGEKLYEELLTDGAKSLATHHEKIMISEDPTVAYDSIRVLVEQLLEAAGKSNKMEVVKILKQIVPEYVSNNSIYEVLD
ncbi:polysaccharide biosynthesis protein [Planobacterium oryzisoli]|uniref:Polysaccharide biosynthesis protein n=1 Tax=Planobacterium oryzisoli TaxID=2771435 RepID=A0A931E5N5_9FLAO|nr:nucleoside-diphosphate sugar epimerase/dehydratase [Planobacterium oryzisoli]MBF5027140.1 polysaccharide biosynthesis protein [Planobacterium oryzisoli]